LRRVRERSWLSGGKQEAVRRPRRQNCADERKEHEQLSGLRCRPHGRRALAGTDILTSGFKIGKRRVDCKNRKIFKIIPKRKG
jgi:hypothetical protein